MKNKSHCWVVVAAFNEEATIGKTVEALKNFVENIVVVDDCSLDRTGDLARAAGANVVTHPINLGQGAALQTGIEYALSKSADYIVTFDADGQHDAAEIIPMLDALLQSGAEVALGSRFIGKAVNMRWSRHVLLKLAIFFTRITAGIKLTDAHNGFRIMSKEFCRSFAFNQNRMAHASEIVSYMAANSTSYIEHPVTVRYTEYSMTKGQKGSNSVRIFLEMISGHISK